MKTIYALVLTMLVTLSLDSCSDKDGEWDAMIWHAETTIQKNKGTYQVAADGETFVFSCRNYSNPWFEGAVENGEHYYPSSINDSDYRTIQGEHFEAAIHGNKFIITFEPNTDTSTSQTSITVTAGDIFHTFKFIQYTR